MRTIKNSTTKLALAGLVLLILAPGFSEAGQKPAPDVSKQPARTSREWVRDGDRKSVV